MLGNKNKKQKTVFGGIGIALLLCALMVLMPMSGYVDNTSAEVEFVEASTTEDDFFSLPERIAEADYELNPALELQGMRDETTKTYLNEDGTFSQIVTSEPIHYYNDEGVWSDINLNIQARPDGWAVTENSFTTMFAPEAAGGMAIQANQFVDPIYSGMNPMIVGLDTLQNEPFVMESAPAHTGVEVGGNVIRYPLADGMNLDYTVQSTGVKQNLVLREAPIIPEHINYFGLSEAMVLPVGYALYSGETLVGEEILTTQDPLHIRNLETGELLAEIPAPVVVESGDAEPYTGTFVVRANGPSILLVTLVETDWLLSEDRVYPLAIDPTINVNSASGGYCYIYSASCYTSTTRYHYRSYGTYYYVPWNKFTFTSANSLAQGASIDKIEFRKYMAYANAQSVNFNVVVLEECGQDVRYNYGITTNACNGNPIASSKMVTGYGNSNALSLLSSIGNSPTAATVGSTGTGWKTVSLCSTSTTCNVTTDGIGHIKEAQANLTTVGIGEHYNSSSYFNTRASATGSTNSHIRIVYSGGTDPDAPTASFTPYTGIDSYIEGERTFFTTLTDMSGIDTTTAGAPSLHYSVDNGTTWSSTTYGLGTNSEFDGGELVSVGTCGTSDSQCTFKARTPALEYGDQLQYYWEFQDLAPTTQTPAGPNTGFEPALVGNQSTPTPYTVNIVDPEDAPADHKKMTTLSTDVHASSQFTPQGFFDRQLTYYAHSNEYFFEFDTSGCGTGSQQCFYTSTSTFYANWLLRWNNNVPTGSYGMNSGSTSGNMELRATDGGYLQINAADGPGMNLIYHYDSATNEWGTVGVDTETGIDTILAGGSSMTQSVSYGYTSAYKFSIPGDITGTFGKHTFNATGSYIDNSTGSNVTMYNANRMCVTTNGWYYFYRAGTYDRCTSAYYMIYGSTTSYRWSGFALGSGYYGRQATSGTMTYKVGNVAPTPDTFAPEFIHTALGDSHSGTRVVSVQIIDAGDPSSGLNTTETPGVGPTMYYRVTPDGGTVGSWSSVLMDAQGVSDPADCALSMCTWTADIEDLEVNDSVDYYFTAKDTSTVSSTPNANTSSTFDFARGDPNKVLVVEWRDRSYYYTYGPMCTVQALFYDVTNEIEYKYDSNCRTTYNSWSIGYMDQTRQKGDSILFSSSTSYNNNPGHQPTSNNYRIQTSATSHGWESFDLGLTEVANANTALSGTSGGTPYTYYCWYYYSSYQNQCNANVDIPAGFEFDYFGTTYDGDDTNDRMQIGRQGYMYFVDNGNTNVERGVWTWHNPQLPYSSSSIARPGLIAPFWSNYNNYYCFTTSTSDCSTYYRIMPYEGKGTDVTADITADPNWDLTDSPIRINPTNDYLVVSSDLTIQPGVEIQIAPGKGISFDGACTRFTAIGNESSPINFTGINNGEWLGMSFTDDCTTAAGTDDRHQFSHVNFNNTTDAVFRAGSRHNGQGPSCGTSTADCNAGNFTLSDVTFSNVGSVFTHGSGQGTVITMTDFSISDVDESCFNLPEDSMLTLMEGTMTNCNTDGGTSDGAVVSVANSNGDGLLHMENVTVTNAYQNFIDVDLEHMFLSNVSVTNAASSLYTMKAIDHTPSQATSTAYLFNVDVPNYGMDSNIDAMEHLTLHDVDLADNNLVMRPGGASQTGAGPSSADAIIDTLTVGDLTMARVHPGTFDDLTAGDVTMSGNAITSETMSMGNFDIGSFSITGCGWTLIMDTPSLDAFKSSASCSNSKNTATINDATFNHGSLTTDVIDGRNSMITVGESTITSTTANVSTDVGKARSGADLVLIDVSLNGNDCADENGSTGSCSVDVATSTSNPSMVYYGGLATVRLYRVVNSAPVWKGDHVVTTTLVSGTTSELFQVGSHTTDANGNASVWVVVADSDGTTYEDHILRAFGTAGQNETYPNDWGVTSLASSWYNDSFTWGDHLSLELTPVPISFNDPNLDCQTLVSDPAWSNISANYNAATKLFTFDDTTLNVAADLLLDGCGIVLNGGKLQFQSSATNSPVITMADGTGNFAGFKGSILADDGGSSGNKAIIRSISSTYGLNLDIQSGSLTLDNAELRDVAQDATMDAALYIGEGATLTMLNGATIYGSTASSDDMATVRLDGGTASITDSTIQNADTSGTALWIENSQPAINGITVKGSAVGIMSYNAAPQIEGFTSSGNTVGVETYGGMSLPTIYRSSSLSGQANGWTTYEFDMSNYLSEGDYLQIGANSIYGGGNAHPSYNYASSKYYFITDRYNVQLEDDNGKVWNVTSNDQTGYYPYSSSDPAISNAEVGSYNGGTGGAPSWHCNYYSIDYGPNYFREGYYYIMHRMWLGKSSYSSYDKPDEFGFAWEGVDGLTPTGTSAYPYRYWGYYSPSFYFNGVYSPPEGANGQPSNGPGQPGNIGNPLSYASGGYYNNYGVCLDYAYTYYMQSGQGARLTMPIVDISASNITKVSLWVDVLHRGNDNYQDRYEFVARAGNDPGELGDYLRESGTPLFANGTITDADYGIDVGGAFAAGVFDNITVTAPTYAGLHVTGQAASSFDGLTVTDGDYGVLIGSAGSGSFHLNNLDLDDQDLAGIYYLSDLTGDVTGSIEGSSGPAFKYGTGTSKDISFSDISIEDNSVGIEAGGSGDFTLTNVTMNNTADVDISGSSTMDFIEGTVNTSVVSVTGAGQFNRQRLVDITVQANVSSTTTNISDTLVVLKDNNGAVQAQAETGTNGVAEGLTFTTQTVDSSGLTVLSTTGYEAVTVAKIGNYYYTSSSDNNGDFRYDFHDMTLEDNSGQTSTMYLEDTFTARLCYGFSSSSYIFQETCASGLSTSQSRTYSNGMVEYGYYYSHDDSDLAGETVMMDSPFFYLDNGNHNWNGSTWISTASYDYYGTNLMYMRSDSDTNVYFSDSSVTALGVSDSGDNQGFSLGRLYNPMDLVMNNTTISGLAVIYGSMAYKYTWSSTNHHTLEEFQVTNSTFTHFRGYRDGTSLNYEDSCIAMTGGDGAVIADNNFDNCMIGVLMDLSPYSYTHSRSEYGSDNLTISGNTFVNGGEVADIYGDPNNNVDGLVVSGNTMNPTNSGNGIAIQSGSAKDMVISDNTINNAADGIYLRSVMNFTIDDNTISGVSDASATGILVYGGSGDVTDNTLVDADGGLYLYQMESPPSPTSALCEISSSEYRQQTSCSWTLAAGKEAAFNLGTDSWGYEISITVTLPNGTTDSWPTYTFGSNTNYNPLTTYTAPGNYTLTVSDSFGDGGATITVLESTSGSTGYAGPSITGNTIGVSPGRSAPNAQGLVMLDCDGINIQSGMNNVTLTDNAMVIENCDVTDTGSILVGTDTASTNGIFGDDSNSALSLNGTDISGFSTGVIKEGGVLNMFGDADITGVDYAVYADDTEVIAIDASVDGGSAGTGLHVVDSDNVWVYPMDASGLVGMYVENTPFRWDGGESDATTTLSVVDAIGSVENMTWSTSTTQIDAGSGSHVTSIGNTLNPARINVHTSAVIDEANLLSMETNHLGAAPANEVALLLTSTDNERASYVSTSFQPEVMTIDGSNDDWVGGNALNPAGFAMPGNMSGDGTDDFLVTYIEGDGIYFGMTGADLSTSDVMIYLSVDGGGSDVGYNGLGGAHNLPFNANYVLWADSEASNDLYSYGFLGWGPSSLSTANTDVDFSTSVAEMYIPWSRLGGMPDQIDIVAIVQQETTADIDVVHPMQTIDAGTTQQNLTKFMTVELTKDDLATGELDDEVLVYRSYKGSITPSAAKEYNLMVKTDANCAQDWAIVEDISVATNVVFDSGYTAGTGETTDVRSTIDILRACPVIDTDGTNPATDGLVDYSVDEDSNAYTFSLTDLADDVQDEEGDLTWSMTEGTLVAHDNILVDWVQNGQSVTITPLDDQFGTVVFAFEVTDSNGLTDDHNITFTVDNINDAPVICNIERSDCMPILSEDDGFNNILPEGFGTHTKFLGDVSNTTRSYIRDMANEQAPTRQVYSWTAMAYNDDTTNACSAFSVDIDNNELTITENASNELGGTCDIVMGLSDDGAENTAASPLTIEFDVSPVNDAPVILDWNRTTSTVITADNGSIPALPWSISLMEDDTSLANLTYDMSAIKDDVDHEMSDLTWTVESTDQCVYTNYFTTNIVGDDLVFTLIEDATTNANDWEIDYLNDNGIHQIGPSGSEYCQIRLVLRDTAVAPSYNPNYGTMAIADYQQGVATKEIGVRVENVREQVPDYAFNDVSGFSFNGVSNVMTGTYVPVTVTVDAGGDEGPYRYDHMLAVTFHTDGHDDVELTRYYTVPAYGQDVAITEDVFVTRDTTHVWVEMDVLTCLDNPCDLTASTADRFQVDEPASHYATINNVQSTDAWSKPGQYGKDATSTSQRRPLLEDSNWCNNIMTSLEIADVCNHANQPASAFLSTDQNLPNVVDTIGASSVPSFAPSLVAVSLAGLFVGALTLSSRRADDEEEVASIKDDETAVSPVIATILMVAITVVLSGVIYVWASSLAETDVKGVPRVTFDIEDINGVDADQGHWRISVQATETDLATQAVEVRVDYPNATGGLETVVVNLAESSGVYGFNPSNSDAFVMFVDSVDREQTGEDEFRSVSTFNTGDTIFVRTHAPDGTPLEGATITLTYAPPGGDGALLKTFSGLNFNKAV